jgi:hypothetical protein
MSEIETNPLAAIAAGLTFPVQAKLVGANGTTAEVLFENENDAPYPISLQLPLDFPIEWTLTGENQLTAEWTQTDASTTELLDRVQKGAN